MILEHTLLGRETAGALRARINVNHPFESTQRVRPGGVVLMVAMGGRLASIAMGAVIDAGLRCVLASTVNDARDHIMRVAPRVILAPGTLDRAERVAIAEIAADANAALVTLPAIIGEFDIAHQLQRALATTSRSTRAVHESGLHYALGDLDIDVDFEEEAPITQRSPADELGVAPVSRYSR